MAITTKSSIGIVVKRSNSFPNLVRKPSESLSEMRRKSALKSASADEIIPAGQTNIRLSKKSKSSRFSRVKDKQRPNPTRNNNSGSQPRLLVDGAANVKARKFDLPPTHTVDKGLQHHAFGASNKGVVPSNEVTSNTLPTPHSAPSTSTRNGASNDAHYEGDTPLNVISPHESGVLLRNENRNLPTGSTVKAKVKIDRLSLTLAIPPYLLDDVLKAARDLCKAEKDELHLTKANIKKGHRYNKNYYAYDGNKKLGLISLEPLQTKSIRFMRVELNPDKIGREGCQCFSHALRSIIGVNATKTINAANITRLDIAVDLYAIDINSLLYFSARTTASSSWGKIFKRGNQVMFRMGSQYIGALNSNLLIVAYDKRAEIIHSSKGEIIPGNNIVRVEFRIKPRQIKPGNSSAYAKCSVQFDNLESMGNPLQKLYITEIPAPKNDDGNFTLLVYAAQHVGAQTALALVKNPKKRAEYRKRLLGQAACCWKPEEYWLRAITAFRKTLQSIS